MTYSSRQFEETDFEETKILLFASSFAFFKVAKKLYVYYQISRLRVDIEVISYIFMSTVWVFQFG